jgi:hypothetical protein
MMVVVPVADTAWWRGYCLNSIFKLGSVSTSSMISL